MPSYTLGIRKKAVISHGCMEIDYLDSKQLLLTKWLTDIKLYMTDFCFPNDFGFLPSDFEFFSFIQILLQFVSKLENVRGTVTVSGRQSYRPHTLCDVKMGGLFASKLILYSDKSNLFIQSAYRVILLYQYDWALSCPKHFNSAQLRKGISFIRQVYSSVLWHTLGNLL